MADHNFKIPYLNILLPILIVIYSSNLKANTLNVNQGILVLDTGILSNNQPFKIQGKWELYSNQLLLPEDIDSIGVMTGFISIPGKWESQKVKGESISGKGRLTVRLKIKSNHEYPNVGFKFYSITNASKIFFNNKLVFQSGNPGANKEESKPGFGNGYIDHLALEKENELVIQISNFNKKSGSVDRILMSSGDKILNIKSKSERADFFMFGAILIMAIYHMGLYFIRRKNKSALYFGLFCILLALRTIFVGDRLINEMVNISWSLVSRVEFLTFYLSAPLFLFFTKTVFPNKFSDKFLKIFTVVAILMALVVLFAPASIYVYTINFFQIITAIAGFYITYISLSSLKRKRKESITFLVGWLVLFLAVINDILYDNDILRFANNLTSLGLTMFIIFQAFLLAIQFSKAVTKSEKLAKKLNYTNRNLSNIVDFRTSELEKQKQDLFYQKMEIENKNQDITDSLDYASKIQTAVLPENKQFKECFDDSFIYYLPKDIVSGDFYWVKRIGKKVIVAAADCTGHGVPGAFMSLLGMAFLNEIVNIMAYKKDNLENLLPNRILDQLRGRIKEALRQTGSIDEAFDGIDMAICILDYAENKLQFAGANNSLFIVSEKERGFSINPQYYENNRIASIENDNHILNEIKADRMPIGAYLSEKPFSYFEFNMDEIGMIYMFSDGYSDQIGGEKETKFRQKRFKQLILDNVDKPMKEQYKVLKKTMENWISKEIGQIDDITVVGIQIHANREERSFGIF